MSDLAKTDIAADIVRDTLDLAAKQLCICIDEEPDDKGLKAMLMLLIAQRKLGAPNRPILIVVSEGNSWVKAEATRRYIVAMQQDGIFPADIEFKVIAGKISTKQNAIDGIYYLTKQEQEEIKKEYAEQTPNAVQEIFDFVRAGANAGIETLFVHTAPQFDLVQAVFMDKALFKQYATFIGSMSFNVRSLFPSDKGTVTTITVDGAQVIVTPELMGQYFTFFKQLYFIESFLTIGDDNSLGVDKDSEALKQVLVTTKNPHLQELKQSITVWNAHIINKWSKDLHGELLPINAEAAAKFKAITDLIAKNMAENINPSLNVENEQQLLAITTEFVPKNFRAKALCRLAKDLHTQLCAADLVVGALLLQPSLLQTHAVPSSITYKDGFAVPVVAQGSSIKVMHASIEPRYLDIVKLGKNAAPEDAKYVQNVRAAFKKQITGLVTAALQAIDSLKLKTDADPMPSLRVVRAAAVARADDAAVVDTDVEARQKLKLAH